MSNWYIAKVFIGKIETDLSGSGFSEEEAVNDVGVNLEFLELLAQLWQTTFSIKVSSGYSTYVYS